MGSPCFDRVVVTSSNWNQCELYKLELERLRGTSGLGLSQESEIFAVSDPLGMRVGSGGATFHAISEAYSPGKSLLVLHSGGDSRRNPLCCVAGKGFALMNFADEASACDSPLERLLQQVSQLLPSKTGVLVCCTDTLMSRLEVCAADNQQAFASNSVTGIGIYTPWDFGTRHGVFYAKQSGFGILQKASEQVLRSTLNCVTQDDRVLLDSGLIHFGEQVVCEVLRAMREDDFLKGLSNDGMDAGLLPSKFELYTDFLQSLQGMQPEEGEEDLFSQRFRRFTFQVVQCSPACEFIHLGTTREHLEFVVGVDAATIPTERTSRSAVSLPATCSNNNNDSAFINSRVQSNNECCVGARSLMEHCDLRGDAFSVGSNCIVSQVTCLDHKFVVEDNMCVQHIAIARDKLSARLGVDCAGQDEYWCYSVFGVRDGVKETFPDGQYCNRDWREWDARVTECLWPEGERDQSLWNARLFPVLSRASERANGRERCLESALWLMRHRQVALVDEDVFALWKQSPRVALCDLVWIADVHAQFQRNRVLLPRTILVRQLEECVRLRLPYPKQLLRSAPRFDWETLRSVDGLQFPDDSLNARTMSLVADLLCRTRASGNACHPDFAQALSDLAQSSPSSPERNHAVERLAMVRDTAYWRMHPERAARHYDMASQLLTGRSLSASTAHAKPVRSSSSFPYNVWAHATAPCRIDLSGGWTDTPPITNEAGGIVVNVAVNLAPDQHALGASCRKLLLVDGGKARFVLRFGKFDGDPDAGDAQAVCTSKQDFADHSNPRAKCALLKSVLLALFPDEEEDVFGLGFGLEVCIWSDLPAGSGLGGSSILSACALLACSKVLGRTDIVEEEEEGAFDRQAICRLVLSVEQLLSTGGGWQDQIGSIYPGFKTTACKPALPIQLAVSPLAVPRDTLRWFEQSGVLVQTGPARLARDLLQAVIRRWHQREPDLCDAVRLLKQSALSLTASLLQEQQQRVPCDDGIAIEVNRYWELKKQVCGNSAQPEPDGIRHLFAEVDALVACKTLCGAGGGGFAFFLLRQGVAFDAFCSVLHSKFPDMRPFRVSVCTRGLCLRVDSSSSSEM